MEYATGVRVRIPAEFLRSGLALEDIRDFQDACCWIWRLDDGLIVEAPTLRLYAGWLGRGAWPLLSTFIQGGRIVSKTDLVALVQAVEPPFPWHLLQSWSRQGVVLSPAGE